MKENESVSVIALVGIFFRLKCIYCFVKNNTEDLLQTRISNLHDQFCTQQL